MNVQKKLKPPINSINQRNPLFNKFTGCVAVTLFLILSAAAFYGCAREEETLPIVVEDQDNSDSAKQTGKGTEDNSASTKQTSSTGSEDFTDIPSAEGSTTDNALAEEKVSDTSPAEEVTTDEVFTFINAEGSTLETRINPPVGFTRIEAKEGELTNFLRNFSLKADQSEVLLYNGNTKGNQSSHVAIFNLEVGNKDLQQCADSVIRMYAEYYWSQGAYDKIAFHLTNGFLMEYTKWRDGNRLVVDGNDVRWSKTATYDDSYETFRKYLTMVFSYAGTLSLAAESEELSLEELKPGDMFLQGGSPGHCVLVVDIAQDKNNNRSFLLAQGYMPAQDFHIIKNPLHPEDPWYYASEISYPLQTPIWDFDQGALVRWNDFPLAGFHIAKVLDEQGSGALSHTDNKSNADNKGNTADTAYNTGNIISDKKSTSNPFIKGTVPVMSERLVTGEDASQVTLLAVGDNLIHIQVVDSGKQADGSYNYDHLYDNLKEEISAADIAIINQETIFGGTQFKYSGYPDFNSPSEIGDAIVAAGFDVVTHATNHTMDKGYDGLKNTFDFWRKYPGIEVLGINETKEERDNITIIEKNGIKLAFLNYTYGLNGHKIPSGKPYLVSLLDRKEILEDVKKAEELADFTIVLPHWGMEYKYEPNNDQRFFTTIFYDAGVDLVIGTHPHVLEPVEWIGQEGKHRMLVYYSLGNFISYQKEAPRMLGGVASVTITKNSEGTFISNAGITPIVTHYEHGPSDYNYSIYTLEEYNEQLAKLHGVSELAKDGPLTFKGTLDLAKQVLGNWIR